MEGLAHNGVWPGSSMGIIYDTAVTTPVLCSLQHGTFHIGLVRPELH